MLVYKYVVPERIDVLKNKHLRFSQPEVLNDPFEIYPRLDFLEKTLKEFSRQELERNDVQIHFIERELRLQQDVKEMCSDVLTQLRKTGLVLSLTKKRNNLVMWSHYTNSHRGFVIGFDSTNSFFHEVTSRRNTTPLSEVKYLDERVVFPPFKTFTSATFRGTEYAKSYFVKSAHWRYEEELRMLAEPMAENIICKDANDFDVYVLEFPPECIREIIFGYLMKDSDKEEISSLVNKKYPHAKLFEAHLHAVKFDLAIEPYRRHTI